MAVIPMLKSEKARKQKRAMITGMRAASAIARIICSNIVENMRSPFLGIRISGARMFREHEYSGNTNIPGTQIFREHEFVIVNDINNFTLN
jgi:hypothetical protein